MKIFDDDDDNRGLWMENVKPQYQNMRGFREGFEGCQAVLEAFKSICRIVSRPFQIFKAPEVF